MQAPSFHVIFVTLLFLNAITFVSSRYPILHLSTLLPFLRILTIAALAFQHTPCFIHDDLSFFVTSPS